MGAYQFPLTERKPDKAKRPYSVKKRQDLSAVAHLSVTVTKPLCALVYF